MGSKPASLSAALATERRRAQLAEAELARLRGQLAGLHQPAAAAVASSGGQPHLQEQQQDIMQQVISISPHFICVEDAAGQIIMTNRSHEHIRRWKDNRACAVHHPAAPPATPVAGPPPSVVEFEECYPLADGETHWFHTTQSPLLRADGSYYLFTFSSDITHLKHITQLAEQSAQARQMFMANMSHEIRTPLHGIMGMVQLLSKEALTPEQADYTEILQASTENLLVVINEILDFAKIESGNIALERIPFDIAHTVRTALQSSAFAASEKGLHLIIRGLEQGLPLVAGDPHRLRQVLMNLLGNAVKFTERGTVTVTIEARRQNDQLSTTFRVADTGIGISPENLTSIFNSFQQANSSISRLYGGTGLGLAICKDLVELQGGRMEVQSEPGRGSCFAFTICYPLSDQPLVQQEPARLEPELLRGLRILFVEDNALNQLIAVALMNQWHVRADMAFNGEEALKKAQEEPYDLILMDIQMPQLDGIAATSRLQAADGPNRHTPVVAFTADALRINDETMGNFGFADFLTKPYTEQQLYSLLARVSQRAGSGPPVAAGAARAPDPKQHYDFQLLGRLANDDDFIRQLLELFIERVPRQLQELAEASERADWHTISTTAHSLKSAFGTLNIHPEAARLKKLEELAEARAPKEELLLVVAAIAAATEPFLALFTTAIAELKPASH
ncbi:ATP-binding protein [Hymenobacter actinosclerus]|uniref:histidine kinase n=1 Tax=Hymenobacter actinosclerus TaxID=82805 RepID=A0A1I0J3Z2_9BACT|nr:ATP-binding protein [Hymenobacter actinosclerus]SEU04425.1 Hpt domain-containing protein [Hymenobacter actinosclerus]